jgi:chromosome partitioning protein
MNGKIITIAQQKGGSGKTTVAAHIAVASAWHHNLKVAILDTDPQGSLGRWFMTRAEHGNDTNLNLTFRTASAWGARYEAQALARNHDIVVIDTPPKMGVDGRPAIETADLVVIPVAPSPVDLWATEPTIEMTRGEKKQSLVVLNRADQRARLTGKISEALKALNTVAAKTMIGNRVIFASSMGEGRTALEAERSGIAAHEMCKLVDEILATVKSGD